MSIGLSPKELDAKCAELCEMYAKRFYTQRDACDYLREKVHSGLLKVIGYGLLPVKVVGKGRDWRIVLAK